MVDTSTENWLAAHAYALLFNAGWMIIAVFIAWKRGFFRLSEQPANLVPVSIWNVILAFLFYLLVAIIVIPVLYGGFLTIFLPERVMAVPRLQEDSELVGWLYVTSVIATGVTIIIYLLCLKKPKRVAIFFPSGDQTKVIPAGFYKPFFKGMGSWLMTYPIAGTVGQIVAITLFLFFNYTETEQSVIKQLKETQSYPLLFGLMVFCVVVIAPLVEETLFRGLVQNWLKRFLGRWAAIILTAILFSSFHFGVAQGLGNFEIISMLLVLAIFLGFVYERFCSLWASIGLHMTFNLISIILLIFFPTV